jgi:alpha-L-fucosidase
MIAKGLQRMGTVIIFLIINSVNSYAQQKSAETYTGWDELKNDVPEWLQDAKFGIYFHWGVYTVPAYNSEWYSRGMYVPDSKSNRHYLETHNSLKQFGYKDYIPSFKAQHFNAAEWADLFVKAGARFAGPVAEHADGFSMWGSKVNRWNARDMGPQKDIVGEMEKAIKGRHLKFITTFHHQWNWGGILLLILP